MVVDELARRYGGRFKRHRARAQVCELARPLSAAGRVVLAEPSGYMNTSGGPVAGLRDFFKLPVSRIVVVHDDLDLPFESVRIKRGGGSGGHNGLKSLAQSLGDPDFIRVRLGIGRPPGRMDPADFVLRSFTAAERTELPLLVDRAADAVEAILVKGLDAAQNAFNS
jgi:peptidyl-tRNA hydrolase, PTH1 family